MSHRPPFTGFPKQLGLGVAIALSSVKGDMTACGMYVVGHPIVRAHLLDLGTTMAVRLSYCRYQSR